jgi:hypothetical protein
VFKHGIVQKDVLNAHELTYDNSHLTGSFLQQSAV